MSKKEKTLKTEAVLTLDNIVAAVVPAIEKALEPKFVAIDARFVAIDARFESMDARLDSMDVRFDTVDARFDSLEKKIEDSFNQLAAMTAREFVVVHREINELAWKMEILA